MKIRKQFYQKIKKIKGESTIGFPNSYQKGSKLYIS